MSGGTNAGQEILRRWLRMTKTRAGMTEKEAVPSRPSHKAPFRHSRRFLAGIHPHGESRGKDAGKRKAAGCPITTVGHDRERGRPFRHSRRFLAGIHPQRESRGKDAGKRKVAGCPITTVGHDRERCHPFCHSRRFSAGIHPQRESRGKDAGKRKAAGCPITTVGHDREKPASLSFSHLKERPFFYFSQHFLAIIPRMTSCGRVGAEHPDGEPFRRRLGMTSFQPSILG